MNGIAKILYYSVVRFGGAMHVPLFLLFAVGIFGIRDFWQRKKALLWCAAAVLGTFVWRIMWLGSINGRSTRYYVFSGVVALFLLPLGVRGAVRIGQWCHVDRLPLKAVHWWSLLIIATLAFNIGPEFAPKDQKYFLFSVSADIAEFAGTHAGNILFLDGTAEQKRLQFPGNVAVQDVGKIRLETDSKSAEMLYSLLMEKKTSAGKMLLLFRQPEDLSTEKELQKKMVLRKISEYPFRGNRYSLYSIEKVL